jgi:hypothetical protein
MVSEQIETQFKMRQKSPIEMGRTDSIKRQLQYRVVDVHCPVATT